ncbi:MAG: hypothetical protein ACI4S3_09460 [Candidatus Gastranaerophilaceae bacterium]
MNKKHLQQQILAKEEQIKQFKLRLESSDLCETLYNKAILEKAILKKELEDADKNKFVEVVKKFIPKKKERICDYF